MKKSPKNTKQTLYDVVDANQSELNWLDDFPPPLYPKKKLPSRKLPPKTSIGKKCILNHAPVDNTSSEKKEFFPGQPAKSIPKPAFKSDILDAVKCINQEQEKELDKLVSMIKEQTVQEPSEQLPKQQTWMEEKDKEIADSRIKEQPMQDASEQLPKQPSRAEQEDKEINDTAAEETEQASEMNEEHGEPLPKLTYWEDLDQFSTDHFNHFDWFEMPEVNATSRIKTKKHPLINGLLLAEKVSVGEKKKKFNPKEKY